MGQIVTKIRQMFARSIAWIREHPSKAVICAINTVIIAAPTIVFTPVLGLLGFTSLGPAAGNSPPHPASKPLAHHEALKKADPATGSIAASLHSALSPIAAGGTFSILQSAAMGGYGVGVAAGAVRVGAAAVIRRTAR